MNKAVRVLVSALFALAAATALAAAPAEKWQIKLEGQSTSEGQVHLRVTPQSGDPIEVTIRIASGRGVIAIAKDMVAGLKTQLKMPQYKSEVLHLQDVLLKAGHDQPAFTVELVESTVGGTKVVLSPE